MKQLVRHAIYTAMLVLMAESAQAYIDPGTGSALIQGLIAVVAALGITCRLYWHRLLRFFGLKRDEVEDDLVGDQEQDK